VGDEAKNVKKLIQKHQKPAKSQPTVAGRMRQRGGKPPKKGAPTHVLTLIAEALKRKKG
jgi:hypothetical protein